MALSTTSNFSLDLYKAIETAIKLSKGNPSDMEDISNALTCSNLVLQEWSTKGVNLWKIEPLTIALSTSTTFSLPSDVLEVLTFSIRSSTGSSGEQTDYLINRGSITDYAEITYKDMVGLPSYYVPVRGRENISVTLWPKPDTSNGYNSANLYVVKKFSDLNNYGNDIDIPQRFTPAFTMRLSYYVLLSNSDGTQEAENKLNRLDALSRELFDLASSNDTDKATFRILPSNACF